VNKLLKILQGDEKENCASAGYRARSFSILLNRCTVQVTEEAKLATEVLETNLLRMSLIGDLQRQPTS
jgi:hypothetical protein